MQTITSIGDAVALVGHELGVSGWKKIDQQRINDFADVTEDRQWIHTDVERAKAESQYGSTIAHGYLTLSLIPAMSKDNYQIMGKMTINYGLNKVRFLDAVTPGSRIRVRRNPMSVGGWRSWSRTSGSTCSTPTWQFRTSVRSTN